MSVDEFFLPTNDLVKSTRRLQLEKFMDSFTDKKLMLMESLAYGIKRKKKKRSDFTPLLYAYCICFFLKTNIDKVTKATIIIIVTPIALYKEAGFNVFVNNSMFLVESDIGLYF